MTTRLDTIAIAVVQSFALVAAALSGERWAILPAVASVVALGVVLRLPRRAWGASKQRVESYRVPAQRADDTTVEVPSPRPAKRVAIEDFAEAEAAEGMASSLAALCGVLGVVFAVIGWRYRETVPLVLCGTLTLAGFVMLGWWARCRSAVQAWRDQERERGER